MANTASEVGVKDRCDKQDYQRPFDHVESTYRSIDEKGDRSVRSGFCGRAT